MARDQAAAISCSVVANVIWVASFATKPDESRTVALADPPGASDGSSKALAPSIVRLNRPCRASYVPRPVSRDNLEKSGRWSCQREQTPTGVGDTAFGSPDPATAGQHDPFGLNHTGFGCDRPHQRNLEFQRRLADARLKL